jgi:hypothetical protein
MPKEELRLSLEAERLRIEGLIRDHQASDVPLAVAAAMTFHRVHGNTRTIVTRADYDDALNIAASALSRLIPIYTLRDAREGKIVIPVDLSSQRFARGATELRDTNGTVTGELSVKRGELESALSFIKRAGLPFSFALLPEEDLTPTTELKVPADRKP